MLEYLHTMIKVDDLNRSLDFYCNALGMVEVKRLDDAEERCTVVFVAAPGDMASAPFEARFAPTIELYKYWDDAERDAHRKSAYGHLSFRVDDIYAACAALRDAGHTINRPPRDGFKAYVETVDGLSVELIQRRPAKTPAEPWLTMPDTGHWNG